MSGEPITITNREIYDAVLKLSGEVASLRQSREGQADRLSDHEARIRLLEKVAWSALGTGSVSLIGLIIRFLIPVTGG